MKDATPLDNSLTGNQRSKFEWCSLFGVIGNRVRTSDKLLSMLRTPCNTYEAEKKRMQNFGRNSSREQTTWEILGWKRGQY